MPTPATPLLLYDNVFDTIVSYPLGTLDASGEASGTEAFRIGDGRRERTYWQPPSDGGGVDHYLRTNLSGGQTRAVDYLVIDRDSNLWGKTVYLEGSADGATWSLSQAVNIPAIGTVGGDPVLPSVAVTEEGVVWGIRSVAFAARQYWRLRIPYTAAFIPIVTGLMAGARTQLVGYSNVFDDDAGERTQSTQLSTAGYRGAARTFTWRTAEIGLSLISATEYDAAIRALRTAIFEKNVPWMLFMDYVTRSERGWLFEYDGARWGMPMNRVHRSGRIVGREVRPKVI